jgi:xanthine dehydrogenase accessory factor
MNEWIEVLAACVRENQPCALVGVLGAAGSTPRDAGTKMLVLADGSQHGTIGGGALELHAIAEARLALAEGRPRRLRLPLAGEGQCCGGLVELLIEPFGLAPVLHVFGAGHVGRALCEVLAGTGFAIEVVDPRREGLAAEPLPAGVRRHLASGLDYLASRTLAGPRDYALVMTPDHAEDLEILHRLLGQRPGWIGLIGSRAKWESFRRELRARGHAEAELERVRCPVGDKRLGKAPREVAIGLAAELLLERARAGAEES